MAVIIEQRFPFGRFHATRWNQNAFEDRYGEWPPSPWRLLRALANRWFQYQRETGDGDDEKRNRLLSQLAAGLPAFRLPAASWRGPAMKQYQPTVVAWTDSGYKKPETTLVEDHYRIVPVGESVYWLWRDVYLAEDCASLLKSLLERTLYFGRAESFSRLELLDHAPDGVQPNCFLSTTDDGTATPVLAPIPQSPLNIDALLDWTDGDNLKGRPIPPGTAWFRAQIPKRPRMVSNPSRLAPNPRYGNCIQFAVGGVVYPPTELWIKIAERFRGSTIKQMIALMSDGRATAYEGLEVPEREKLTLLLGKHGDGRIAEGHRHAHFLLWPDETGAPSRLVVWRKDTLLSRQECDAMLSASEWPISWGTGSADWQVRLVPLPSETPLPKGFCNPAAVWRSVTPFVPPASRHRFRKNGHERPSESVEECLRRLLEAQGLPAPISISILDSGTKWLQLHQTLDRRRERAVTRTRWVRPGFLVEVRFNAPVQGPIMAGDSSHFGLGLFRGAE